MEINEVLNIILPIVFIVVGIALVIFIIELIKTMKLAQTTIADVKTQLDPTLENVKRITDEVQPVIKKVDPLVERVQLTVDSVNLEMMRVDRILEDVTTITDSAASATTAVDNIANAPLKAVNSVATKVRSVFGGTDASAQSEQLAEQRVAVGQALQEFKAAEKKEADSSASEPAAKKESTGYVTATEGEIDDQTTDDSPSKEA